MEKWSFNTIKLEVSHNQFLERPFMIWSLYGMQVGYRGNYVFRLMLNTDTNEVLLDSITFYKAKRQWPSSVLHYNNIVDLLIDIRDERLQPIQSAEVEFIGSPREQPDDAIIRILLKFLHDEINNYYSPPLYILK